MPTREGCLIILVVCVSFWLLVLLVVRYYFR